MPVSPTPFLILPPTISAIGAAVSRGVEADIQSALGALCHIDAAGELARLSNAREAVPLALRLASSGKAAEPVDTREVVALLYLLQSGTGSIGTQVTWQGPDASRATRGSGIHGSLPERFPDIATVHIGESSAPNVISLRMCQLTVTSGSECGREIRLEKTLTKIGAGDTNDMIIEDDTVSREHCEIEKVSDGFLLRDTGSHGLGSRNGTFLNGGRIKAAYLSPGDRVMIGRTVIEFAAFDEGVRIAPLDNDEFGGMVGGSEPMRQIFALLKKVSPTQATVMIEGETGTGKELVARAIHEASPRKDGPFYVVDCSAIPPNLIESELFGHEKGSFTGAVAQRQGAFELANGGTIFLDEIGELTPDLQPKLLRVLEQREIKRVGGNKPIKIDVRIVCATNRDLDAEVRAMRFRSDLYFRLFVVKVSLPPLRERVEDIPLLVKRFIARGAFNKEPGGGLRVRRIDDDALHALQQYRWPGNVRELLNAIERAVAFADGGIITRPLLESVYAETPNGGERTGVLPPAALPLFKEAKQAAVEKFEREYLASLMELHPGNVSAAARAAGVDAKHLRGLLGKYGM